MPSNYSNTMNKYLGILVDLIIFQFDGYNILHIFTIKIL